MRKGNIIIVSIIITLFIIVWFSCDPFHESTSNDMVNKFAAIDGPDVVRASIGVTTYSALQSACDSAASGDVIEINTNSMACSGQLVLDRLNANITITAGAGYNPVLDFSALSGTGDSNSGIMLTGSYYTISKITVANAGGKGILLKSPSNSGGYSSHNTFINVTAHHNGDSGFYIGTGSKTHAQDNTVCAYNTFTNCDAYMNFDDSGSTGAGGNADGFSPKLDPGPGNSFSGCRSWNNSDDGWDCYATFSPVTIDHCWTWHNGDRNLYSGWSGSWGGNGQGIKVGMGQGKHIVQYNIAFNCKYGKLDGSSHVKGFDQNNDVGDCSLKGNLSFSNNVNYGWWNTSGVVSLMKTGQGVCNQGFDPVDLTGPVLGENAHFDARIDTDSTHTVAEIGGSASTYGSTLTEALAGAARQSSGDLPTGFAQPRIQ